MSEKTFFVSSVVDVFAFEHVDATPGCIQTAVCTSRVLFSVAGREHGCTATTAVRTPTSHTRFMHMLQLLYNTAKVRGKPLVQRRSGRQHTQPIYRWA